VQVWRNSACLAITLVIALLTATGCGASRVSVTQQFPVPVVERLPVAMGIWLDEALLAHAHTEELESGKEWQIELGSAQTAMFQSLLAGMFERGEFVTGTTSANVDGVLVPSIEELQFSTPDQTRTDYFEVWIRYQMKLYGRNGELVADWPLTAYGQSNSRNFSMQGQEPALQAAALAACRDAMAFFIVQFRSIPAIQEWLAENRQGPSA